MAWSLRCTIDLWIMTSLWPSTCWTRTAIRCQSGRAVALNKEDLLLFRPPTYRKENTKTWCEYRWNWPVDKDFYLFGSWETTDSFLSFLNLLRNQTPAISTGYAVTVNDIAKSTNDPKYLTTCPKGLTCCHPLKSPELEHCLSCKSKPNTWFPAFESYICIYIEIIQMETRFTSLEHGAVSNFVVWTEQWRCGLIMGKPMTASAML